MRPIQWHLKRHWPVPEILEKLIPISRSLHPDLDWWLEERNVHRRQHLHPLGHALQMFTDTSNEGWGAHLGDSTARGMWSDTEGHLHISFLELKAVFLALKSFKHLCKDQIVLVAMDNTTVVSYINKEGCLKSGSLCARVWRLLSWCHPRGIVLRAADSRSLECDGRQIVTAPSSDPDRVVPISAGIQSLVLQMGLTTDKSFCDPVQPQISQICVTSTGSGSLGSRCPESPMGESGRLCFSTSVITQQVSIQGDGSGLQQNDPDCTKMDQHGLVLEPGQFFSSDSLCASSTAGSSYATLQRAASL